MAYKVEIEFYNSKFVGVIECDTWQQADAAANDAARTNIGTRYASVMKRDGDRWHALYAIASKAAWDEPSAYMR